MKKQWLYDQFSKIDVNDARLKKRAVDIAIGCAENPEGSLAKRFDDWADLKATYRFFSNPKITHQKLQKSHITEFKYLILNLASKYWKYHPIIIILFLIDLTIKKNLLKGLQTRKSYVNY